MVDSAERPFSTSWTVLSVVLFLVVEAVIGSWLGPLIVGKYVSPMFHFEVQVLMHLLSFYAGGWLVGLVSPGRRLVEPAVGAFVSALLVFGFALFMPSVFFAFTLFKALLAGGLAFVTALVGAWQAERVMGNLAPDDAEAQRTARGRLRSSLWSEETGLLRHRSRDR